MFSANAAFISIPTSAAYFKSSRNGILLNAIPTCRSSLRPSLNELFFRNNSYGVKRNSIFTTIRPFSPVMEWQDCTAKMEVDVPCSVAYNCYSDREAIPRWMPFISSVTKGHMWSQKIALLSLVFGKLMVDGMATLMPTWRSSDQVLEDKPDLSRWSLKYKVFGRDIEFSWLARNLQPIPNQKIHWRSLEGLPNRGSVRFYPKGPSACIIELTVSYEVPQILSPVASALKPLLEALLLRGLGQFAKVAKSY